MLQSEAMKKGFVFFVSITGIMVTLVLFTSACSTDSSKRYVNKDLGFSINFPKNWVIKENFGPFDIYAKDKRNKLKDFNDPLIFMFVDQADKKLGLDDLYKVVIKNLSAEFNGFIVQSQSEIEIDNSISKQFTSIYKINNDEYKQLNVLVLRPNGENSILYHITGQTLSFEFRNHKDRFYKIVKSFKFE